MKLTLYDFNNFSEAEKGEAVFKNGTFIDDRDEGGLKVQLYRLNGFYVEVFYDPKGNKIDHFRVSNSVALLSNYIKPLS